MPSSNSTTSISYDVVLDLILRAMLEENVVDVVFQSIFYLEIY